MDHSSRLVQDTLATFSELESSMSMKIKSDLYRTITFSHDLEQPIPSSPSTSGHGHYQILDLDPTAPENMQLLYHRDRLTRSLQLVSESKVKYGSQSSTLHLKAIFLEKYYEQELAEIQKSLRAEWDRRMWVATNVRKNYVDMTPYHDSRLLDIEPRILAAYLMVLVLYSLCGLSMDHCSFFLGGLNILLELNSLPDGSVRSREAPITDIRTVEKLLTPEIRPRSFISCPKCSYLYPFQSDTEDLHNSVPETCTNRLHPDSQPCSRKLWSKKRIGCFVRDFPTREFLYHSLKDWVAWMYSRADIETILDKHPTSNLASNPSELHDIWDASGLRDFQGPDNTSPFIQGPGNEARLIFSLNMDGFNPYTNKEAGKKVTTGGIYMVCLNLPRSIRYKEENMYLVGIIPGPHEPSLHEINYLLKPLVDELLEFWETGFFLSHTPAHTEGRWVRCAIVPLVCDLPASRQMCGAAHYTAECFCSYCWQQLSDINDLDCSKWELRTMDTHRKGGELWLRASTKAERDSFYAEFGTRWSELLRLPYWDPVKFTVIDSMHAFYLRIISYHCREIWGMDSSLADGDIRRKETDPTDQEMKDANIILRTGSLTQLKALSTDILRELCIATTTLTSRGRKGQLLSRLVQYRNDNGWPSSSGNDHANNEASLNEEAESIFNLASKSALNRSSKTKLLRVLALYASGLEADVTKCTKAELVSKVQEVRQQKGVVDGNGKVLFKKAKHPKSTAVLGKDTLTEIRHDMARTHLPSWFSRAPKHPGEKKWGKLTASNWRSFALVNLPITLIRLWGDEPKSSRKRQMLDNYMHLVAAVKIATMRTITVNHISQYKEHIHSYLTSLLILYPKASITPYQHLSLHFADFLERFGPTHAWQCFPFERYNNRMQQIPTNQKFGEMEKTMSRKFRLSQFVRSFFNTPTLPSFLGPLVTIYQRSFATDISSLFGFTKDIDHLPHDLSLALTEEQPTWEEKDLIRLSSNSYPLLKEWIYLEEGYLFGPDPSPLVFPRRHIIRLGQKFATNESSVNDSHVLFHSRDHSSSFHDQDHLQAGNIVEIFSHTRTLTNGTRKTQTFVIVAPFKRLSKRLKENDIYREFSVVANQLFQKEQGDGILMSMEQVISHFAYLTIALQNQGEENGPVECVVAYPLDL